MEGRLGIVMTETCVGCGQLIFSSPFIRMSDKRPVCSAGCLDRLFAYKIYCDGEFYVKKEVTHNMEPVKQVMDPTLLYCDGDHCEISPIKKSC